MKNEFEDIFGELRDAEIKAPDHLWSNIKEEIRFENGVNSLKNTKVTPQSSVWNTIKYRLLLHNFLTFSYNTFNIYYLGAVLLVIAVVLWHPSTDITTGTIPNDKITEMKVADDNSSSSSDLQNNNSGEVKNDAKHSSASENFVSENVNSTNKTVHHNTTSASGIYKKHEDAIVAGKDTNMAKSEQNTVKLIKSGTIIPVDTFIVYDTIRYYDTIKVLQPHHFEPNTFNHGSIGFCTSGGFLWSNTEPVSDAFAGLTDENNSALKSKGSYSVMLEASLRLNKRFSVISGIGFSQYFESFEYMQQKNVIDTSYGYKFFNVTQYVYSQHNYIKYDTLGRTYSLVLGADSAVDTIWRYDVDTVIFSITDSTAVTVKDSEVVMIVDTNTYTYFYNYINRYSYVQIPLYMSYSYDLSKRFTLNLKGGIVANILINAKGYGINFSDTYEVVDVNELPFLKLFFNFYAATGLTYHLDNRYSLCADIYYSSSGNILDKDYFMRKKFYGTGIKLGFKYGF